MSDIDSYVIIIYVKLRGVDDGVQSKPYTFDIEKLNRLKEKMKVLNTLGYLKMTLDDGSVTYINTDDISYVNISEIVSLGKQFRRWLNKSIDNTINSLL